MIYFISDGDFVKIGYSESRVKMRLKALKTGSARSLVILGVIEGDKKVEQYLHTAFEQFRQRGEWFFYSSVIQKFVKKHCDTSYKENDDFVSKASNGIDVSLRKNRFIEFSSQCLEAHPTGLIKPKSVYNLYKDWNAPHEPMTPFTFGVLLSKFVDENGGSKGHSGSKGGSIYRGIRIKVQAIKETTDIDPRGIDHDADANHHDLFGHGSTKR